jgi:hypothetical protein
VLAATILAMLLTVGLRPVCEYSAECYRDADWSLVRGGIVLLIGAVAVSPVLAFLAG